jgi:vitamin B12/bleomycin/antimicrobial peptide transport system ATP-binding/permease protein
VADRSLSGGRVTRELYAVSGSWLTWRVSRPLNAMNAERYAREAELRFAPVRISDPRRTSRCTAARRTSGQLASLNRCVEYLSARLEGAEFRGNLSTCPLTWVNAGDSLQLLSLGC